MVPFASESLYNEVSPIKTGTFLDKLTGIHGIPRKRITEVFGDAGVGKSSVFLQAVAQAQSHGVRCLWADVEWSYDAHYATALGVANDKLGLVQEQFAEDCLDKIEEEVRAGNWDLVVIDSIGGLLPRQEAEKGAGESTIGGQAKLVARFCRKIVPLLALRDVALVVINHSFIDLMSSKIMASGGKKLDFHKSISIRLKVNPTKVIKQGDRKVGKVITAEVRKNKVAATEGMVLDAQIIFGDGFSSAHDQFEEELESGKITKTGNTYYRDGTKIGVGTQKAAAWLKEHAQTP